jgi:TolA-binding protein
MAVDSAAIKRAEHLFDSASYSEAALLYKTILDELRQENFPENSSIPEIKERLLQAHYEAEEWKKLIALLRNSEEMEDLYYLGLSYRKENQNEEAINAFNLYLNSPNKKNNEEPAWYELGMAYLDQNQLSKANDSFKKIVNKESPFYLLAQISLVHISIMEKSYAEAIEVLNQLQKQCNGDNPLHYEIAYLLGEANYHLQNYEASKESFKESIPEKNGEKTPWRLEALYHIGKCHLNSAEDPLFEPHQKVTELKEAQEIFENLIAINHEVRFSLELAKTYLRLGKEMQDPEIHSKGKKLVSELSANTEIKLQLLQLRAEAASYDETAAHLDEEAVASLEELFHLAKEKSPDPAAAILKHWTLACIESDDHHSLLKSFDHLQSYLEDEQFALLQTETQEELLYLKGWIAYQLLKAPYKGSLTQNFLSEIIEASLKKVSTQPSSGKLGDRALFLLGTYYFDKENYSEAERSFLEIVTKLENSTLRGEALYWLSRCAEKLEKDPKIISDYRRQVYEKYPESPMAAEAYFTLFTYREYLQGSSAALKHLHAMPQKYPNSPFLIDSYYLIGLDSKRDRRAATGKILHRKNLQAAIDAFHSAETLVEELLKRESIPMENLEHYISLYYRAALERGGANLMVAEESKGAKKQIYLEYAIDLFQKKLKELEDPIHPLAQKILQGDPYPEILEECEFNLAEAYILAQDDLSAEQQFSKMLEKYNGAKITRSYFLARVHQHLGQIAFRKKEYTQALSSYKLAEDASKGGLFNTNQSLALLIEQSRCYRHLNQLEQSMKILSEVVNENAVSGERLRAMFLRAEIYELQGRSELARKQLEALAKKSGEWSQKAKIKLEQDYEY